MPIIINTFFLLFCVNDGAFGWWAVLSLLLPQQRAKLSANNII